MRAVALAAGAFAIFVADGESQPRPVDIRDVLTAPEIREARIAPGGEEVVYAVRIRNVETNQTTGSIWRARVKGGPADSLPIDGRAFNLRWRPDGAGVSYIAPDSNGIDQVWDHSTGRDPRQRTSRERPILSFEWSPNGQRLAFTSSLELRDTAQSETAGVLIDRARFFHQRLLFDDPLDQQTAHYINDPPRRVELWVNDIGSGRSRLVSRELSVNGYAWSPSGRALALTARGRLGRLPAHMARHDLLMYDLDQDRLRALELGRGGEDLDHTVSYEQPFWSPDGRHIAYFRRDWRNRWASTPQLGVYSLPEERTTFFMPADALPTYKPRGYWVHPDTVLVAMTQDAGRRLSAVSLASGRVTPATASGDWRDRHSFSSDGRYVAFVRERIDMPPDLYVSDRAMREPLQITDLHGGLRRLRSPRIERVHWAGNDGVEVEGWLYLPAGAPPYPTIVFVHGGPTWVYGNRYEPYVPIWPYPLSVYAGRGMAVFVPNYRGTGSYGKAFLRRSALDAEPVTDIIGGIDTLIALGLTDPERLGILGHSHGCWLGPLVAVRHRRFDVGACAEPVNADWVSHYGRGAGWMNSEIVEHYWGGGASPYEEPERYRRLSPTYGFRALHTPFLFEAGEDSQAIGALEYGMAAWRAGMPHELIIYRRTGHNVTEPRVMLEIAERNLEWFAFWLLGREQSEASKRAQYARWRELREGSSRGTG